MAETIRRPKKDGHRTASDPGSPGLSEQENLAQIRDILFGSTSREIEDRLESLDRELKETAHHQRQDLQNQLQSLGDRLLELSRDSGAALENEKQERADSVQSVERRLDELRDDLHRIEERQEKHDRRIGEAIESIEGQITQLVHDKLDQSRLVGLFEEMTRALAKGNPASSDDSS